ncbi:LD-carboxypeptidase, partial [Escherichia coli]
MSLFHLIAPSGYCIKQHAALRGIHRLTDEGHQVNNVEVIARRCERFAGTETERLEDLNSLARLTTPNTIVLAVRGGYGASRLLADIDWQAL